MQVEVWSDLVCPWCYLGKRRLEAALERVPDGAAVEVVWRSFQLSPETPAFGSAGAGELSQQHLVSKYGLEPERAREMQESLTALAAEDGLAYRLDLARHVNTFDAHRMIHAAAAQGAADGLVERLFSAQLVDGRRIDDPAVLTALAVESGVPEDVAAQVLASDAHADAVRADVRAAEELGCRGVPFFVLDRRYGVSGAQSTETLVAALDQALADEPAQPNVASA
jgi:predicted DsbA family dithiol-disulfide isomerase